MKSRPRVILVEGALGSVLLLAVRSYASRIGAAVWLLTGENYNRSIHDPTPHGNKLTQCKEFAIALGIAGLSRLGSLCVDHAFNICKDGIEFLQFYGLKDRLSLIPLGFDPALFRRYGLDERNAIRANLGLTEFTIAYFGRLIPEKGVLLLIKALGKLRHLRWQFIIDRFSDYQNEFAAVVQEEIKNQGIERRIVWIDARHDEVPYYMNAVHLVAVPSFTTNRFKEQYGRVVQEAMACGAIVVGTNCGALPELIQDFGIVVPEADLDALATAIEEAAQMSVEDHQAITERAFHYASARLSVRRQAECYDRLLSAAAAPA